MAKRKQYRKPTAATSGSKRRKKWVSLTEGDICLWSLRMHEVMQIAEACTRPPEDPRGGIDKAEAALWQIALSCYEDDTPTAKRIWQDHEVLEIWEIDGGDFDQLILEINLLNGKAATMEEVMRDFTPAAAGSTGLPSSTGVSTTSTGSLKN